MAAAIFGGLGIAFGASVAHGLQKLLTVKKFFRKFSQQSISVVSCIALLAIAIMFDQDFSRGMKWVGISFIAGINLFPGHYACLLFKILRKAAL